MSRMINSLISRLHESKKASNPANIDFCDTCNEVCDQTCRAKSVQLKNEQKLLREFPGLFRSF